MGQEVVQTVPQGLHFFREEQLRQHRLKPSLHCKLLGDTPQVTLQLLRDRLSTKIPDHRAQLGMHMEGQAMINPPDVAIFATQAMAGFAVSIVGNQIKKRHPPYFLRMLLP